MASNENDNEDNEEGSSGGGLNIEVARSYLAFARRALRARRVLIGAVLALGIVLMVLLVRFLPRTYTVTTVLMTVETEVLDGDRGDRAWAGAEGLIMRHENLESLIRETGLVKKYPVRRPPLLKLKDRIFEFAFGAMSDKVMTAVLVGTLETKLQITPQDDALDITVEWSDPNTAAEVAEAVKDGFLRIRHRAEISAFQEKMAILDAHAVKLREEIDALAIQVNASLQTKAEEKAAQLGKSSAVGKDAAKPVSVPRVSARVATAPDAQLPQLREQLAGLKQKLNAMESERGNRVSGERAKLDELKVKLTANHPQVMAQEERLGLASQVSSELALLRAETSDLEAQIKQRDAMAKSGTTSSGAGASAGGASAPRVSSAASEPLPGDILALLDRDDADPAVTAQMAGAVVRYGSLRDEVRGAKIALDTAQAAFNHRYQIVIPVEVPGKATKPNLLVVCAACFLLTLLLALALPIVLELKSGVLVERWQVDHFQLPVLAELRLPEHTPEQR